MKSFLLFVIALISTSATAVESVNVTIRTLGDGYSPGAVTPTEIPAKLTLPPGSKLPAVLIVHGSGGPDSRARFHTDYLSSHGYAVLEIDMWSPRNVTSLNNRPAHPGDTLADVWGAWAYLRSHERIDKDKVAIMGFSWGGIMAMSTAFGLKSRNPPGLLRNASFAAHVAFYPVCDMWLEGGSAGRLLPPGKQPLAPVQIHNGTRDDYDTAPDVCERVRARFNPSYMELHMYPNATHGFDSLNATPRTIFDPVAKNFKGAEVNLVGNQEAREQAKARVLMFLARTLKTGSRLEAAQPAQ